MKKNNKGISLINLILLASIVICAVFIFIMTKGNNNDVNISSSNVTTRNVIQKTEYKNEKVTENVELSNEILSSGKGENTTSNNEGKKYFYRQLNDVGKSIYNTLINNRESLKSGTQKIDFDIKSANAGDSVQAALDALFLDNPDIFWIDILKISFATRTTTFLTNVNYSYFIEPKEGENNYLIDYLKNGYEVQNAIDKIENRIKNIVSRAKGTTYDKVKMAHDELVNTITYDENLGINSSNIYGALVENKCVCEGYAESFKVILDELNIPCVIVYGDGIDSEGNIEAHAWNYVKMDNGKWYAVDATWDDPIIIGGNSSGVNRNKYFLKGSRNFIESHKPDGDVSGQGQVFEYPVLSETDY